MAQIPDSVLKSTPLAEGGEGIIFDYQGMILKVYKNHVKKHEKEYKITKLITKQLSSNIIAPVEIAYNNKNQFIGYLMRKVDGDTFGMLCNKKYIKVNNITVKDISNMLLQIKNMLLELHAKNIYISDLNENNFLFDKQFNVYAIDVDSWTVDNIKCDVCMEAFQDPLMVGNNFSEDTDNYAFAILSFKGLTRLHPFGGVMNPNMQITERMKQGLSVIDRANVTIPKTVTKYQFISPSMLGGLKSIFESKNRVLLDVSLEDFGHNLKQCSTHGDYYYSKYTDCPLCNANAKVLDKPVKAVDGTGIPYILMLVANDVKMVITPNAYINTNNKVINITTQEVIPFIQGEKYYFSNKGDIIYLVDNQEIKIQTQSNWYAFKKTNKSGVVVKDNKIYYADVNNNLIELTVSDFGNSTDKIADISFNSIFEVNDSNNYFICNIYDNMKIINVNGYNYTMQDNKRIQNYGIHFDAITKKWLFITEDRSGKFDTYVFNITKQGLQVEYHNDTIRYTCPLGNMCFSNGTVFKAIDKGIRGFNYEKNVFKDFPCDVINEDAKLIREGSKFIVLTEKEIYKVG